MSADRAPARHVGVAAFIVNNNPETMERSRRLFPTAGGWFFARSSSHTWTGCHDSLHRWPGNDPRCLSSPHIEEPRLEPRTRASSTRHGAASRSMRARAAPSFETGATRPPQEAAHRTSSSRLIAEPLAGFLIPISRCQRARRMGRARAKPILPARFEGLGRRLDARKANL